MSFYNDPSTNVALPLFTPGTDITYVSFDKDNKMFVKSYYDDTVTPPSGGKPRNLYRWYVCKYKYSAYLYDNLCWTNGEARPQNPTCKKVGVERVFKK